jgi:phospholipid/cholesterol/gamma-HCH transport system substrate-binding protein
MNIARYVKISLFVLTIGVSGFLYIVMAADGFSSWNTKLYEIELEDATGLYINSQVFMAGVPVGKIRAVELKDGRALLKVAFFKDVEIRGNAYVAKQASSLLGTSILALTPGTPETPILKEGDRIGTAPVSADFQSTLSSVGELSAKIGAILDDFQKRHMELLAVSLQTINVLGERLDDRSKAEFDRISRILESTALIAERLELLSRNRDTDLDASILEVRAALENIRQITEGVRRGDGSVGRALTDDALYAQLLAVAAKTEEAAVNLSAALKSVDKLATSADKVVVEATDIVTKANRLGIQVDARSDYDFGGGGFVAGAALRLDPRSGDRWYRVGVSGAPDGVASSETTTVTAANGDVTTVASKSTFSFDAELARIIGPFTLRGGLLASTAGFGLDYRPLPNLELSGELFDFGADEGPNLRSYLTFYPFFDPKGNKPWQWLYLRGGVTSALNENRGVFLGAGFRFADEEARGLVGLVPLAGN